MFDVEVAWDRPARTGTNTSKHVLRVRIVPHSSGVRSLPLRMAVAFDVSGSMRGEKLERAREACCAAAGALRPEDQLSLASFSTRVTEVMSRVPGGGEAVRLSREVTAGMVAHGVTRTDLALEWLRSVLPDEPGTVRAAILVTDGRATDPKGETLVELDPLVTQAGGIGSGGITLCAVGLGDASHFNASFLTDLSDRGRGRFIFAQRPAELQASIADVFARSQATVVDQVTVNLETLRAGITLGGACRYAPTFMPLDPQSSDRTASYPVGAVAADGSTDLLVEVRAAGLGFNEPHGSYDSVAVSAAGGGRTAQATAALEWTPSLIGAQQLNRDVEQQRLGWDLNLYSDALAHAGTPMKTGDLLTCIVDTATQVGAQAVAADAAAQLEALRTTGVLDLNTVTRMRQTTRDTRNLS